ncbi:MAG: DUF255 domain-containing protein [Bacteroidota bacterium]
MKRLAILLLYIAALSACNSNNTKEVAPEAPVESTAAPATPAITQPAPTPEPTPVNTTAIEWMTFEEAVAANQQRPKKFFVDVYTSWCGWCKVMDKQTFTDPDVIAYMNEHFYPVKFNAEQKETVTVNGQIFEFIPDAGRRGVHTLAYSLLQGRMSYPSVVYMNEQLQLMKVSPGFKRPEQILPELRAAVAGTISQVPG